MSATTQAKLLAAFHSAWITFLSIACGMYLDAAARGASTIADLEYYARVHWVAWAAANVIAPAIRAIRQPSVPDFPDTPTSLMPMNGVANTPSNPTQPAQAPGKV